MSERENLPAEAEKQPLSKFEKRLRGWRPNAARPMTEERKALFLSKLAEHGIVGEAAKRASLHSARGALASFYREREKDDEFAEAWDEALEIATASIESELHRRAVRGVEEPVFWQGREVGSVRKYSDTLLLARIRKLDPTYQPKQKVEHAGAIESKPMGLGELSPEKRELLRQLLADDEEQKPARIVVEPVEQLDHGNGEGSPPKAIASDSDEQQDA